MPKDTTIDPVTALIPLIALGFVVGQGLHTVSVLGEKLNRNPTHREIFVQLLSPAEEQSNDIAIETEVNIENGIASGGVTVVSNSTGSQPPVPPLVKAFYVAAVENFPNLGLDPDFGTRDNSTDALQSLYTVIRSQVHSEGVGRSRIMQSIYAFCRSIWGASVILSIVYLGYGLAETPIEYTPEWAQELPLIPLPSFIRTSSFPYETILQNSSFPENSVIAIAPMLIFISYFSFAYSMEKYKKYYIQYLLADYVVSTESADRSDS
jgi:hypothetical protein